MISLYGDGRDQVDIYRELLEDRKDSPCSPEEQAGQWWDGEKDSRLREAREK